MPERQKVNREIARLVEEYWNLEENSRMAASINRERLILELQGLLGLTVEAAMAEEAEEWMERARDAGVWRPFAEKVRREVRAHGGITATASESENLELLWQRLEPVIIATASAGYQRGYASCREDMRKAGHIFPKRSRLDTTETAPDISTFEENRGT